MMTKALPRRAYAAPLASLLALSLAGCVPLFYAYPSISYVPALNIGPDHDNIYVFRVDIAADESSVEFAESSSYRFRQIHVSKAGKVLGQSKVAVDGGFYWNMIALSYTSRVDHNLRLRLYRAGHETIEISSWQSDADLAWKPTPDLRDQEKAVDALATTQAGYFVNSLGGRTTGWSFGHLEPGSSSREQRHFLLFAAAEYERLASSMGVMGEGWEEAEARCRAKVKDLRALAEK